MIPRKNSKNDELNNSNYCLFGEDSPKNEKGYSSNNKGKKLENSKSTVIKKKKNYNFELNQYKDFDIDSNNFNINNKDSNDEFNNFKLFQDSHRETKIKSNENNNNNINNNRNNLFESLNPYINNEGDEDNKNDYKNKNIYNNIINKNNNYNNKIVNININNKKEFNKNNKNEDSKMENNSKINNKINFNKDNINNSFKDEKKTNISINQIKNSKINKNNISEKNNINKENKKVFNNNRNNIHLDLQNNINDKNEIDKIKQNMKLMNNKNINKPNKTFIFSNNKSPFKKKETEEEKREREKKEKERNDVRNKLKCYLCFGKINRARLCLNCQKIACENCVKNMLLKHAKCLNCKKPSTLNDIILLPFMDDITSYFINMENNQNQNKLNQNQRNFIIDEDDEEGGNKFINNFQNNENNNEDKNRKKCANHKDKYIEYYCFQCGEHLCPKCLLFFDQSVAEKHKDHTIASIADLKNYNIKEAIDEYNKLKNSKNELDKLSAECEIKTKILTIKKDQTLKYLEEAKKELEWSFKEKINIIKDLSSSITNKKEIIENSIDSVPNSFSNIIAQKDFTQGKQIFKELKKLNSQLIPLEGLNPKYESKENNLYYETFQSEEINLVLPQNGIYLEELKIIDKEIKLIDEHESRFKIDLLGGNFVFTLTIKIGNEYYNKYHPMFKGYFILINSEKKCEYANFIGNIYTNEVQILTIELEYEKIKKIIGENNEFKIICLVDKIYYK